MMLISLRRYSDDHEISIAKMVLTGHTWTWSLGGTITRVLLICLSKARRYGAVKAAEVLLNFGVNVLAKDKSQKTILHHAATSRSQRMLEFLADKAAQQLVNVEVEARDIANMTAQERLHELEPTAELLAAFTRLNAAISNANILNS